MSRPQPIAVLSHFRSGSTLLVSVLAEHPEITVDSELFEWQKPYFWHSKDPGWSKEERNQRPLEFIETLCRQHESRYHVFKIFPGQNNLLWSHWIENKLPAIVHHRRDPLRAYLSLEMARKTDQWSLVKKDDATETPIRFSPAQFEWFLDAKYWPPASLAKAVGHGAYPQIFPSTYEEMGRDTYWKSLFEFLGVGPGPLMFRKKKQGGQPFEAIVENYDQMVRYLTDTGRAHFLNLPDLPEI